MTEKYIENPFQYGDYVETSYGSIHRDDIPYVIQEPFKHKFTKAFLFYSVFIIIFILIIYLTYSYEYHKKVVNAIKVTHMENIILPPKKIPSSAETSIVKVYNYMKPIPLEHIILIDVYNNVIDVDIQHNYFVHKYKIGEGNMGELYSIDFGSTQIVKEIVLQLNPDGELNTNGVAITLDLYNIDNKKTWSYSGPLSQRENTIQIYKEIYVPMNEYEYEKKLELVNQMEELSNSGTNREIILFNENTLSLKLREQDENYDGY
jgi:hypothetical protein